MDEWASSPCASCHEAPCCRRLPLEKIKIETRRDLQRAALLLAHRWFELGLRDDGSWTLFYSRPCRKLDPLTSRCLVHGSAEQPWACRVFAAHPCWYRRVFAGGDSLEFIRFDASRLSRLEGLLEYDRDSGEIAGVPVWEAILSAAAGLPLSDPDRRAGSGRPVELWFGCRPPSEPRHLELFKFRLVFPGIRVAAGERAWYTVAETAAPAGPADAEGLLERYMQPDGRLLDYISG